MMNPYNFIDINFKVVFKVSLESHDKNHTYSLLTITPIHPDFGKKNISTES